MTSSSVSKNFVPVYILVVVAMQLVSIDSVLSLNHTNEYLHHVCIESQGKYKSGSPYENNINDAIDLITKNLYDFGYMSAVVGDAPNTIYPKLQCRGDVSKATCRSCIGTAFSGIRKNCPNHKGSIIWYDNCVLEISSVYTFALIDYQNYFYLHNTKDVNGDKNMFNKKTRDLLYKLKEKAINKETSPYSKHYMFATGRESFMSMKLYAMTQCIKDLSHQNCSVCLDWIMSMLPKCCNGKQGGRVLSSTCYLRYELYPFVNPTK